MKLFSLLFQSRIYARILSFDICFVLRGKLHEGVDSGRKPDYFKKFEMEAVCVCRVILLGRVSKCVDSGAIMASIIFCVTAQFHKMHAAAFISHRHCLQRAMSGNNFACGSTVYFHRAEVTFSATIREIYRAAQVSCFCCVHMFVAIRA